MRPDVALAFDRLAAAAREEATLFISISSGFRSDADQAALFAAHPDPKWVAPPGESLHRYTTELDLGPLAAYGWLEANADRVRLHQEVFVGSVALGVAISPDSLTDGIRGRPQSVEFTRKEQSSKASPRPAGSPQPK
jgi:hypothetical protein